ncbi:MAG: histone deacetylase family protein [Acidimicrobiia bacterium]
MRVVHTPDHRFHDPEVEIERSAAQSPYEHGGRVEAIKAALVADDRFSLQLPTEWGVAPIEAVHDPGLVRLVSEGWSEYQRAFGPTREVIPDVFHLANLRLGMGPTTEPEHIGGRLGWWCYETTTPLVEGTFRAACSSVDTALSAMQLVLDGEHVVYGLCRPPGHHASAKLYGGYCFFNNAAVAAHHAARATGTKVAVLDVDYHHGNGTQQIFYERDDVMYVSLHGDPRRAYPYAIGFADETGAGAGAGANLNLLLPEGLDDDGYLGALDQACDAIDAFGASLLVVSLGLDTFVDDPICDLAVTTDGFEACGRRVGGLGLPTVVVQEGGYDVDQLGENVRRWLLGVGA